MLLHTQKLKLPAAAGGFNTGSYLCIATGTRLLALCESAIARITAALQESRRRQAAKTIEQYLHSIETDENRQHNHRQAPA